MILSAWIAVLGIAYATLVPLELRPQVAESADVERFGAFAVAGLLLGLAYPRRLVIVLTSILAFAAFLEGVQHVLPDRHGELHDLAVKSAGSIVGVLGSLFARLFEGRND